MKDLVVITGCSSGIGHAIAIEFAKKGYQVIAGARRLDAMKDLTSYEIEIVKLDVTSIDDVLSLKKLIETKYDGKIKYLYNNAGQPCQLPAAEVGDEDVAKCFEVNVYGCIRVTRELMDFVIKTKGTIGYTGSVAALAPIPFLSVYSASKAAIHAYADTLAFELEPFGVKVINVVTGGVKTGISDDRPLAPNTRYQGEGFKEILDKREEMKNTDSMSPKDYGLSVIRDFENSKLGTVHYYRGTSAGAVKFVARLPRFLLKKILHGLFGTGKLWSTLENMYSEA
ncbi:NADPH-dependent 1-acyldihydroxyacetone phosphate reductase [[Candida] jaroonii]|uniref:NADPH-dependent 1-acyldihydroxyacetone phosphate reductase n=1 Tax=[Candida] jaroonii TaxID=467808 RepID=A0ACA9YAL4_9ASCO|nr:NADPH-dependent 1-acyldihydroxyacetone phosphate reductase [[Candida] jaroonii]